MTVVMWDSGVTYLLRDTFTTDRAAGAVNGTAAEPGPGTRTVVDTEGVIKTLRRRLRGLTQTAPAWGDSRVLWPAQARIVGMTLAALVLPEDSASDLCIGWTASAPATPYTEGYGLFLGNDVTRYLSAIVPGAAYNVSDGGSLMNKPMQYLVCVVLLENGSAILASTFGNDAMQSDPGGGIPAYPTARILAITTADAGSGTLQPYVSAYDRLNYPDGHSVEDVRVVTPTTWMSGIHTVSDTFTRSDSAVSLGGSWGTPTNGVFGISSNKAYRVSATNWATVAIPGALIAGDGILVCDITAPTNPAGNAFGVCVRRQDGSNFIRIWNNFTSTSLQVQSWFGGAFDGTIMSGSVSWVAGQTYRVCVVMRGNRYRLIVDGVVLNGGSWGTDSNNRFLTENACGLFASTSANGSEIRWDNFAVYPQEVTLPAEIQAGAHPLVVSGGATLANDSFTDTNATPLGSHTAESGGAWTVSAGTCTIVSNRAVPALLTLVYATQDIGAANAEAQLDVIVAPIENFAGIVLRWVDANNHIIVRTFMSASQMNNDEIEIIETIGGSGAVVHKVALGNYYTPGGSSTLKVQAQGDLINVFLDGQPKLSYITQTGSPLGTRWGIYSGDVNDGCTFDNWSVKAL